MPNTYPLPCYHFSVEWGGSRIGFKSVSGLNMETEVIEYRDGSNPVFSPTKMPGVIKFGNIILTRGIVKGDNDFFHWMNTIQLNTAERRDISIQLLDETHSPVMIWKVRNAFPVKYNGPFLQAQSNEVAIESLELAHEGISVETA